MLLSRYDDVMVTMLLGELAAGNFGGEQASLGGSSGASASAAFQQQRVDAEKAEGAAQQEKTAADADLKEKETAATAASIERDRVIASGNDAALEEQNAAEKALSDAERELAVAKVRAELLDKVLSSAHATAASSRALASAKGASGGTPEKGEERKQIANELRDMQRKYLENINADAIVVACISALDRPQEHLTPLSTLCSTQLGKSGLLASILSGQSEMVRILKERALHDRDIAAVESHANQLQRIRKAVSEGSKDTTPTASGG